MSESTKKNDVSESTKKRKPVKIWKIVLVPIIMFGFAFSLVPLYDVFCNLTGLNGRSESLTEKNTSQIKEDRIDHERDVRVTFVANVAPGLPMIFYPKESSIKVIPGKTYKAIFIADNRSNDTVVGQAIPNVTPPQAAAHFRKLECFCFQEQVFAPKERVEMLVRFTIDPLMNKAVKDVSLSYTFYLKKRKEDNADKTNL